ncbi:TIR domain-containing protein [Umezawaea endophytica]|uniref:TIR domain-containing protein n=1 Tax=Umezawaea endophytica TaxID=1654476 RepID=A0A9X2VSB2_9PSEU|nr:TIR domain-containing protein [Umezawaea endophytica]MCS7481835.1 TIR domain-containing protein [Umezawaea endophytica]
MSAGIAISWVEADRSWAEWIAYQVDDLGFPVHLDYRAGSNRVHEFDRMLEEGYRVFAVVSDASLADEVTRSEWLRAVHRDPTGKRGLVAPLLVRPGDAGPLSPLIPVPLYDFRSESAAADRLLTALGLREKPALTPSFPGLTPAEHRSFRSVDRLIKEAPAPPRRVLHQTDDALPRLRVLSGLARSEAGQVPHGLRSGDFGKGLYVERDVAPEVLGRLLDGTSAPQLLVGGPGTGKTSLLWGLANGLLAGDGHEVFLLKATWLRGVGDRPALVDAGMIAAAVERAGQACTLLVDTADLVVTGEAGHLALVEAVNAAADGGASVVVTSRPDEAGLLPEDWVVVELTDYATDGSPSEFERAVASHSRFYCHSAENARGMAARIISAVARQRPLGSLCLRPLTLRMLFQLYAPSAIADNVDITDLYYEFWRDRVVRDRRVGSAEESSDDVDLAGSVRQLAVAMLRDGIPEVAPDRSFDPGERRREVDLLVQRGVGELVVGSSGQAFRFFHQTFFEFAAAQALLHARRADALALLHDRIRGRPDDYLLLAVFEQAWLCAWRDDSMVSAARNLAVRMLADLSRTFTDRAGDPFPYALQRTILSVLAQSPDVPEECWEPFGHVLARASLPVARDCLALMPPPQRRWTEHDVDVLKACADRADAAWVSVLGVLSRLAQRDPELAVVGARRLELTKRAAGLATFRAELPRLFTGLLTVDPEFALAELRELGRLTALRSAGHHLVTILRPVLDREADLPDVDLATWADGVVGATATRGQAVTLAHAEAHRIAATRLAERYGWSLLLVELKTALATVAAADKVASRDGALLGGVLAALATDGPLETVDVVALLLRGHDEPQVHAEINRGWLVGYTRRAPNRMLDRWADWLAEGLPASHKKPVGARQRWADTVRRTLERQDVEPVVAVGVAEAASRRLSDDEVAPWLDPDVLLRLVVRGAGVGSAGARAAVAGIAAGQELAPHAIRTFIQQSLRGTASPEEQRMLLDVLIERRGCGHLHQFLERHPDVAGYPLRARSGPLRTLVESGLGSDRATDRRDGARLLVALVRRDGLVPPALSTVEGWLGAAREVSVRKSLVQVLGLGLASGHYPAADVRRVLAPRADWDPAEGAPSANALEARSLLVVLLAGWGAPGDAEELLRLAFREPVESAVLGKVSGFVRHGAAGLPFLLDFGRRLRHAPRRACKDTAVRWRPAMAEVLAGAEPGEHLAVLDALRGDLDEEFAASVVLHLEPRRHAELRHGMTLLLDEPDLDERVRRNIRLALVERTAHRSRRTGYDWPDLLKP